MALEPLELVTGSCRLPDVGVESQILVFCESNLDTTAEPPLQLLFFCETFFVTLNPFKNIFTSRVYFPNQY